MEVDILRLCRVFTRVLLYIRDNEIMRKILLLFLLHSDVVFFVRYINPVL